MIEKILYEYLSEALFLPVYTQKPERLEEGAYVVIEKTGSSTANHLEAATMAIQSYGQTLYEAIRLNGDVKKAMRGCIALPEIAGVRLNTDYNFSDTASKQYRYQAVFVVTWYEEAEQ